MTLKTIRLSSKWPDVEVLFEDTDLLALNKPGGLLVAPDRWDPAKDHLVGLIQKAIRGQHPWVVVSGLTYAVNVHRLDKDTSGVLLLARTHAALVALTRQFEAHTTGKQYVALVEGTPAAGLEKERDESEDGSVAGRENSSTDAEGTVVEINLPIGPNPHVPGRSLIDKKNGKPAFTRFTILEKFRRHTLVRVEIATGRQHQIRVHARAAGCPVVADPFYGSGAPLLLSRLKPGYKRKESEEHPLIARTALHAETLTLAHPTTGAPLTLTAPWPKDLTLAVKYLRKFAHF